MAILTPLQQPISEIDRRAPDPLLGVVSQKLEAARILAQLDRLAPLPTVVLDVIRAVEDPRSSVSDLEAIICRDLIITARVFKLANSFFYARNVSARTIGEAVQRLGFRTIKTLVIAAGAGKVLMQPMKYYPYQEFGLWKHSLALALTGRVVARYLGMPRSMQDELFLAGLMHDVGKLVLDPLLGAALPRLTWPTIDSEMAVCGLDHTEIGRRVGEQWHLPDYAVAVIHQHHHLDTQREFLPHIAAIHLSDYLMNHARIGIADEVDVLCQVDLNALAALGIDAQSLGELQKAVMHELPTIIDTCEALIRC